VAFVAAAAPPVAAHQYADAAIAEEEGEAEAAEAKLAAEQQEGRGQQAAEQPLMNVEASSSSEGYSELSEHALLSMQVQRASQAHGAAAEASAVGSESSGGSSDAAPNLVLASGWCRSLCIWEECEERVCDACRRLPGHAADVLSLAPLVPHVAATGEWAVGQEQ